MATDDGFNAEFSFTWKIKNFSYISPFRVLRSPIFTVKSMDKTRWHLSIRTTNFTARKNISYYLSRERVDSGPEIMRIAFELSFLDRYGFQLVKESREDSVKRYYTPYIPHFVELDEVFINRRCEYLPEDTLTACCRMRRIGGPTQIPISCSFTSVIGVEQCSFEWNIENFSETQPGMIRAIRKRNPSIHIELTLTAKPEEALQFQILQLPENYKKIDCEISVLNAFKDTVYSKKVSRHVKGNAWKFPVFLKKCQLTAEKNVCLQKDVLALKFDISFSLGVISSVINDNKSISYSPKDEASPSVEECSSTEIETISSAKKFIGDLKKDAQKVLNVEGKNTKEILEEFSNEDSSSPENESFSPTQTEKSSSIEDETISSVKIFNGDLERDTQKVFNFKGKNTKEILEKFSDEDSSSPANESFSPTQNEESSSSEHETEGEFNKFDNKSFSMEERVSVSNKRNELQRFYQDGTFSDINLIVGNETFPAHKLILSLKSRKFKEIFMSDLSKRSIKVTDVDPGTLRDLLIFIYTNNVENMTLEKAQKLFSAAETYEMTSLKNLCLVFIKENINESNACNVLILADKQQDEELKQVALTFIVSHGKAIMNKKSWDELKKKHIKLAFETMQQMYLNKI
ncbi:Speckle-type POZ protein B [Araneus ventricosus]|uniref:Speckle-type POZ protein B n=1 Tax=Araneus ventricosus TaxID=182803 RepID=A0A4Y2J0F2_ARAVE|nr:Speckle-type POZ protein B [Araneus ventricosus]